MNEATKRMEITHNSKLEVFICGEQSFAQIAKDIADKRSSTIFLG